MNCLFLTRWAPYPPLRAGDIDHSRNIIENLARVMPVHALVFKAAPKLPPDRPELRWTEIQYVQASKLASLASTLPNVANRHHVPAYLEAAGRLAAGADAIVVDHLGMASLVPYLVRSLPPATRGPIVLINHNFETSLRQELIRSTKNPAKQAAYAWDAWKAARLERNANRLADGLTAITSTDLTAFRALAPATPGLLSMPGYSGPTTPTRRMTEATPLRVSIVGGRGPMHKQIVLERVLDAICARGLQRELVVDVVGGGLGEKAEALKARFPGINFLGFVDDLQAYFETSRLGLIPDEFGGGFKIRALSHIFMRIPMLALPVALSGMELEENLDFIPASSIAEMLEQLPVVIRDLDRLNAVQDSAYRRAQGRFDWSKKAQDFYRFIEELRRRRTAA